MTTRRDFIRATAVGAGMLAAGDLDRLSDLWAQPAGRASAPLTLLILGGTGFIGPHLVRHAVSRGHRVTIFTRGRRDGNLPDGVTRLVGDRNGQLGALEGKKWDAVIDDSATNPEWVKQSATLLASSVGRYLFTSSTGVYYPYLTPKADESVEAHSETRDGRDPSETYGVNKRRCELEVLKTFGDRGVVVRPTYIVGPGDTTDRFPYWVARVAKPGTIMAPGRRNDPLQWIDVRDLAAFYVKLLEDGRSGIYNGVDSKTTVASRVFYETLKATLAPTGTFAFVDDFALLRKHDVEEVVPWVRTEGNNLHATEVASIRSAAAGLTTRPLADTLNATAAWWATEPETRRTNPRFAITPAIEAAVLAERKGDRGR